MQLPDLDSDIGFEQLPQTQAGLDFSYAAKRAALGPHVIAKWGWDEAYQRKTHADYFSYRPFFQIILNGHPIGTVSLERRADHIAFNEFYLFPEYQNQGLGSRILDHCLRRAEAEGLPVRLQYLKWNPVGSLYRRHGFKEIGATDIHYVMEKIT